MLVGIDIGGSKICVCTGEKSGKILNSKKIATQELGGAKKGLVAIAELIRELSGKEKITAIGISSPGPISTKEGKMLNPPNLPGWENTKLVDFFERTFQKPIHLNNDANAGALAEYRFGSKKGCPNLIYLTCSTGMGGGIICNGKLLQGASDTAGEVGHFVLDIDGDVCPCGQRGCFETFCGGAALAKKAGDVRDLISALKRKDPQASKIWEEYTLRFAQGVGTILMCFNPEALILGTIAIHAGDLLLDPLKKKLPHFAWKPNIESCRIETSAIAEHLSELSALALAIQAQEKTH